MRARTSPVMRKLFLAFVALLVGALLFLGYARLTSDGGPGAALERMAAWLRGEEDGERGTYWCPMDPEIVRGAEGMCPICNMALVPFEQGAGLAAGDPAVLVLSDRQVQQSGVRLGTAEVRDLVREIDAAGRLEVDPARRSRVVNGYPSRSIVERLHVFAVGTRVAAGDVLLEVSNDRMLSLLADYRELLELFEHQVGERRDTSMTMERIETLKEELLSHGLPESKLLVFARGRRYRDTDPLFPVIAGADGLVVSDPGLSVGSVLAEDRVLFELADLSELWLLVDVYEHERPFVAAGQTIEFSTLAVPDRDFAATIRLLEPMVQARTQTVRARAVVADPEGLLAPGMFVRARIASPVPGVLSVPESSVLQSGRRDVALVAEGGGRFRPRIVELGRRHLVRSGAAQDGSAFGPEGERYHEVRSGVRAGERVVVAGNFLLNAEAQFQGVLQKMVAAHEREAAGGELTETERAALDAILARYVAIGDALVLDDGRELERLAGELASEARRGAELAGVLAPRFGALATAGDELAQSATSVPPDWTALRTHFGSLSRAVVTILRDHAPTRVTAGELFVFRCPMADDYGFDLWVQRGPELANPYMGQAMVECGVPATLE